MIATAPPAFVAQATIPNIAPDLQRLMSKRIGGVRGSVLVIGRRVGLIGKADVMTLPGAPRADAKTRFELGQLSETVTGLLLADAVRRGEARLDEPIDERATAGLHPPVHGGKHVTFADLATHRSGFPRVPLRESVQPYRGYDRAKLFAVVNDAHPSVDPGAAYAPSNLEFALLGTLLADRAGTSYAQLAKQRIFVPLDMPDSAADDSQDANLVPEHAIDSTPVAPWRWDAFVPEGGIRSTLADLLAFSGAFLEGDNGPLAEDARMAVMPRAGAALGWTIDRASGALTASGWSYGSTSFIGILPQRRTAVVLLSNAGLAFGDTSLDDIGLRLLSDTAKLSSERT